MGGIRVTKLFKHALACIFPGNPLIVLLYKLYAAGNGAILWYMTQAEIDKTMQVGFKKSLGFHHRK